jgi:5-oxoprolinase (ATP-hydrolysing) subunit A
MIVPHEVDYRKKPRFAVDLNFDGGEGHDDEALMEFAASVNIACGGHSGDERSMRAATRLALRRFVAINAHPAYQDVAGFGRAAVDISPEELELSLSSQIETLRNIVRQEEGEIVGVKPHGALYHEMARRREVARAVARAAHSVSPRFVLVASPGSKLAEEGAALEMAVAVEGFVDRAYRPDGSLIPRGEPGAVVTDPKAAAAQALSIVCEHRVKTKDGSYLGLKVDTLCLHGDTPGAREIGRAVRTALLDAEVVVRPLRGWVPRGPDPGPPKMPSR